MNNFEPNNQRGRIENLTSFIVVLNSMEERAPRIHVGGSGARPVDGGGGGERPVDGGSGGAQIGRAHV